ncbi:hypothetical protein LTR95_002101 [Oleoguttula sp. CCFEE 5521]
MSIERFIRRNITLGEQKADTPSTPATATYEIIETYKKVMNVLPALHQIPKSRESPPKMQVFHFIASLSLLFSTASTSPISSSNHSSDGNALLNTVYQFPNETWVENIAVRSNGKLLVALLFKPEVWQIDPVKHAAELVYTFPAANCTLGIAEYGPDMFGVNVGNFTPSGGVQGSYSVWSLDLGQKYHGSPPKHTSRPHVVASKILDIPLANFLNGLAAPPLAPGVLFSADSGAGVIYRVDTKSGTWSTFLDDPSLKPNASAVPLLGVNGLQVRDNYLYYDNTFQTPLFARVPFHPTTAKVSGPVEVLFDTHTYPLNAGHGQGDDFSLDKEGNVWLATASSSLVKLDLRTQQQTLIAGEPSSFALVGSTATKFARNGKTLYITTNGGISDPVDGIEGGKVVSLDTSML